MQKSIFTSAEEKLSIARLRCGVESEMAKLLRQEQEKISVDCKKNEIILAVYQ